MSEQLKVGQYLLQRKLGEGGMAQVWEARHIHLGTVVAIKFLLPALANDPELEDRFLNESKRQARLVHPNIVPAIDFVQQDGHSYLIMQFIDGENLETKLKQQHGPMELEEVFNISWDVLSALDCAHSMGVVHRDVKPSNILIDTSGRAWLMDFGIALALTEERRVTRTGTAVGTPDYMSPEQIVRPKDVDARSDIYSFGCVLYAMLSGAPPFGAEGASEFHIKESHVRTPPPPLGDKNASINPAVEQVVQHCLDKDPDQRPQTCAEVLGALNRAMSNPDEAPSFAAVHTASPSIPLTSPTPVPFPSPNPAPWSNPVTSAVLTPVPLAPQLSASAIPPTADTTPRRRRGKSLIYLVAGLLILVAAVAGYFLLFNAPETELRLEGSTTVGDALAPALLKAFLANEGATDISDVPASGDNKDHHDVRAKLSGQWRQSLFTVSANGSANAFTALHAGTSDVGMASRPIKDGEFDLLRSLGDMRSPACESIVALDGIAVIVNPANSVPPLTRQQLGAIFRGTVNDWAQVGGRPGPIHLFGRDNKSGTFDTFVSLVLGGDKSGFSSGLQPKDNGDEITKEVLADPNAIGYVSLAQIGSATPLELSGGQGTTPLVPSDFTVATEDYILSRRLFFYAPANPTEMARKFITFALSPEGQKVVKEVGFVTQTPHFETIAAPADAPAAYRLRTSGLRRMSLNFRFRPNGTALDTKALADIPRAIAALTQGGIHENVLVLGFADNRGGDNQRLSEQRAQVVAGKLRAAGIGVDVVGFSSAMPVGDNSTDDGRMKNRRVEVWAP